MKEATGELNMTVVTIVLIGVITTFFAWFWPNVIKPNIQLSTPNRLYGSIYRMKD